MMSSFLRRSFGSLGTYHVDDLVREIAERSVSVARSRLRADAATISAAEMRGYVRARAHAPVRELTRQSAAQYGWHGDVVDKLIARALERTVHLVVRQAMPQPIPAAQRLPGVRQTG